MVNLVSMTNWFILVNVDFCHLNIEGELIIRFSGGIEFSNYIKTYAFMSVSKWMRYMNYAVSDFGYKIRTRKPPPLLMSSGLDF